MASPASRTVENGECIHDDEGAHSVGASVEQKYKRRLMTAMQHVLPELKAAEKACNISQAQIGVIKNLIEHDNHQNRRRIMSLIKENDEFKPYFNESLDEQREHALRRLKKFCEANIIRVEDFEENPMNIFMAHETFAQVDGSFATKLTVQFNLWGGTVFRLGSEQHREFFAKKTNSGEVVGCFGLSELGYGNNAVEMETTATYDTATDEFVVHSPSVLSQKYWITNGACHAHYCVVFAQLLVDGKRQGVHGFLVQIRDLKGHGGSVSKGCRVEDMGLKIGLNGIDNAKILFNNVRIPRTNMLSSYAEVEKGGNYVWKVKGDNGKPPGLRNRFLRLADQLLSGRLCISSMMLGGTKVVISGSLSYMLTRMGVGPGGKSDTPILDYQLCQHEVFPLLARLYATQFYHNYVKRRYEDRTRLAAKANTDAELKNLKTHHTELIILCSSVKPIAAWLCDKAVIVCRERVGGVGFLEANGYGGMFAHAGITAEGDARVLCAKVCKELMDILEKGDITPHLRPIHALLGGGRGLRVDIAGISNRVGSENGKDLAGICRDIEQLFAGRVAKAVVHLKEKLIQYMSNPKDDRAFRYKVFDANLKMFSDEIQNVALTYGQWESVRSFNAVICSEGMDTDLLHNTQVQNQPLDSATVAHLGRVNLLYALDCLELDAVNALRYELVTPTDLIAIQAIKAQICLLMRPQITGLLGGLGIDQDAMWRPLAKDWKKWNEGDNYGEVLDTGRYLTGKS